MTLPAPADDALWNRCKDKGDMLWRGTWASDAEAGQLMNPPQASAASPFTNFPHDLYANFWQIYDPVVCVGPQYGDLEQWWGLGSALGGLEVSDKNYTRGGLNMLLYAIHQDLNKLGEDGDVVPVAAQRYYVELPTGQWETRPATGAHGGYAINPFQGVIIELDVESPKTSAEQVYHLDIPPHLMPRLSKRSDIAYGLWTRANQYALQFGGATPDKLRPPYFYLIAGIIEEKTRRVIARVVTGGQLRKYPGEIFFLNDERAHALLGTRLGAGVGYFLMQHKAQLGRKTVSAITVFQNDNDPRDDRPAACLLYSIADAVA